MHLVRTGLRDDVDETTKRATIFGTKCRIENAELLNGFLRRRYARQTGKGLNVVDAVDKNHMATGDKAL
jgi:hypothetical protein